MSSFERRVITKEEARARLEAKLDLINALHKELDERAEEILKALKRMDESYQTPQEALATQKQVDYAASLLRQLGRIPNENELKKMTRSQISKLIDELLEKAKPKGK